MLLQIPDAFMKRECKLLGIDLPGSSAYGVGMLFMPQSSEARDRCAEIVEKTVESEGLNFLGWRSVPVEENVISGKARQDQPVIMQCLIHGRGLDTAALERRLYVIRRQIERLTENLLEGTDTFYIPSMSCRTITYKGLFTGDQLPGYYRDLGDPDLKSALAVIHQRYSTNTFPSWELAQPFRYLAHNGEINTLRGNLNLIRSRETSLASGLFGHDIKKLLPIIDERGSDSACLDNVLELLHNAGASRSLMPCLAPARGMGCQISYRTGPARVL